MIEYLVDYLIEYLIEYLMVNEIIWTQLGIVLETFSNKMKD